MTPNAWNDYERAIAHLREVEARAEYVDEMDPSGLHVPDTLAAADKARTEAERARALVGEHAPSVDEMRHSPIEEVPADPSSRRPPPWKKTT